MIKNKVDTSISIGSIFHLFLIKLNCFVAQKFHIFIEGNSELNGVMQVHIRKSKFIMFIGISKFYFQSFKAMSFIRIFIISHIEYVSYVLNKLNECQTTSHEIMH